MHPNATAHTHVTAHPPAPPPPPPRPARAQAAPPVCIPPAWATWWGRAPWRRSCPGTGRSGKLVGRFGVGWGRLEGEDVPFVAKQPLPPPLLNVPAAKPTSASSPAAPAPPGPGPASPPSPSPPPSGSATAATAAAAAAAESAELALSSWSFTSAAASASLRARTWANLGGRGVCCFQLVALFAGTTRSTQAAATFSSSPATPPPSRVDKPPHPISPAPRRARLEELCLVGAPDGPLPDCDGREHGARRGQGPDVWV
jgi:hypothetical protein